MFVFPKSALTVSTPQIAIKSSNTAFPSSVLNTAYSELKNKGSDFKIPDGKNTDEMRKFYNKLGRPETPDGYKFEMSDYDQESSYSGFKEAAFKNGLTSAQAEGLYGDTDAFLKDEFDKRTQTMERMKENSLKELKQEWGKDYEDKMSSARNAFKNMGLRV
jgi:hypothetical protein